MGSLLRRCLAADAGAVPSAADQPPPGSAATRPPGGGLGVAGVAADAPIGDAPTRIATAVTVINFISDALGSLPVSVVETDDRARRPVRSLRHEYLWGLPHRDAEAASWWQTLWMHYEGWNEAFIFLRRVGGQVVGMDLLHPSRVTVAVTPSGARRYRYRRRGGGRVDYGRDDVVHVMRRSWDQVRAVPPLRASMPAHRIAEMQDRWQHRHYRTAGRPSGVLTIPAELDDEALSEYYELWDSEVAAPGGKGLLVLQGQADYDAVVPPSDAHLLASMGYTREQILGAYAPAIPHHLLGWRSNTSNFGTGIEAQGLHLLTHVFDVRLSAVGRALSDRLLPAGQRLHWETGDWLRQDAKGKAETYGRLRQAGALTRDELRSRFALARLDTPDDVWQPKSMTSIPVSTPPSRR